MRSPAAILLSALLAVGPATAADPFAWPSAGRSLPGLDVAQTAGVVCGACHGTDGAGRGSDGYPPLAGQDALYLAKQLHDYASGTRPNAIMEPIAKDLSPDQRAAVADHYASLSPPSATTAAARADGRVLAHGARLVATGDWTRGIAPCASCHDDGAEARPPASPVLTGMPADYTAGQLRLWAQGVRRNDAMGRMAQIAARLTAEDIAAVAAYYAAAGRTPDFAEGSRR